MRSLKVTVALCLLLTTTGIALMFLYVPSTAHVMQTAQAGDRNFRWGYILRGLHFWIAQSVVLTVLVHFVRVLTARCYRPLTGGKVSGLLAASLLVGLLWFMGILLPWDQLTYWLAEWSAEHNVHMTLLGLYKAHVIMIPITLAVILTLYFRSLQKSRTQNAPA